jgi:hypothetical protein
MARDDGVQEICECCFPSFSMLTAITQPPVVVAEHDQVGHDRTRNGAVPGDFAPHRRQLAFD